MRQYQQPPMPVQQQQPGQHQQRTHGQNRFERGRDAKMHPGELMHVTVDELLEIAKDKWKSRSLQRSLMENDVQMTELIYEKAEPAFVQLLSDQYGNYLSQKILEHCSDTQFDFLFSKVEDKLPTLANEVHGTRAVQKFVEEGIARGRTQRILTALIDHVEPLSRSVTGFHVVVKLLEKLSKVTGEADAVLGKLCYEPQAVVSMAKDQWGCCVLKTCVDKAEGERLAFIVDAIVNSTLELVQDPYGNYVVQHVLATTSSFEYVLPSMIERLKDHVLELCQQKFSSNVLEKVLTTAPESHKNMLIEGVLNAGKMDIHSVVQHLLFHQYGNYVLQQTLAVARDPYLTTLIDAIRPYVHQILRHMLEGEGPTTAPIPRRGGTSLAPEQAQRLAVKLGKRFPVLLEGLDEHEKAMLISPNTWGFRSPTMLGNPSNCSGGALNNMGTMSALNTVLSPNGTTPGYNTNTGYADYSSLLSAYGSYANPLLAALSTGNYNYSAADLAAAAALQSAAGSAAAALGLSAATAAGFGVAGAAAGAGPTGSNQIGRSSNMAGYAAFGQNHSNPVTALTQGQNMNGSNVNMGQQNMGNNPQMNGFVDGVGHMNMGNTNVNQNGVTQYGNNFNNQGAMSVHNNQMGHMSNGGIGNNTNQNISNHHNLNHSGYNNNMGTYNNGMNQNTNNSMKNGSNSVGAHAAGGGGGIGPNMNGTHNQQSNNPLQNTNPYANVGSNNNQQNTSQNMNQGTVTQNNTNNVNTNMSTNGTNGNGNNMGQQGQNMMTPGTQNQQSHWGPTGTAPQQAVTGNNNTNGNNMTGAQGSSTGNNTNVNNVSHNNMNQKTQGYPSMYDSTEMLQDNMRNNNSFWPSYEEVQAEQRGY